MTQRVQEEIRAVCTELADLLVAKNREYGNSALEPRRIFSKASPVEQLKVRLDDKLSRIATVDEGGIIKEDTIMDLMGYLVLYRVAQKLQSKGEKR